MFGNGEKPSPESEEYQARNLESGEFSIFQRHFPFKTLVTMLYKLNQTKYERKGYIKKNDLG